VAEAVGLVLPGRGQFRQAAEHVAPREILLGVAVILLSRAEVLSGFTQIIVVVVVMMTMAAVAALVTLATEETTQHSTNHISNERCCETCESEHRAFSFLIRVPAPTQCQTSGALLLFCRRIEMNSVLQITDVMAHDMRQNARERSISLAEKTLGSWQEPGVFLQWGSIARTQFVRVASRSSFKIASQKCADPRSE
jgi:hypothetical protein